MQQWQHMTLRVERQEWDGRERLYTVTAPDYTARDVQTDQGIQGDRVQRQLDELGQEGWHLAHVESEQGMNMTLKTYWLRRPAQPQGSPQVY